jgi:hypothetical protein
MSADQFGLDNSILGSPVLEPFRVDELRVVVEYFGLAGTLARILDIAQEQGLMGESEDLAPHRERLLPLQRQLISGANVAEDILVLALETDPDTPEGEEIFERFVTRHEGRIKRLLRMN